MRYAIALLKRQTTPFWMLSALLILAFAMGGGSRSDIASLIALRPIAALMLGYGIWGLTRQHVKKHRFLLSAATAIILLVIIQLIPLPPSIWSALPGRELISEIDRQAGLGGVWRPISLVPSGTWNAFFALLIPVALLVMGVRLTNEERSHLIPVVIGLGLLSAIIALMQLESAADSPLYFYAFTNNGAAVGLFANRNHQAVFLATLFPMLAVYASAGFPSSIDVRVRGALAFAAGIFLVPLILVAGSRAGLIVGGLGLLSVPFLYRLPKLPGGKNRKPLLLGAIALAILVLTLVAIYLGRGLAIERLIMHEATSELRYRAWGTVLKAAWQYFPVGSGFGTFPEVFLVHETRELLTPTRFNHAHNDWLELLLAGGLPALLLLGALIIALIRKIVGIWQTRSIGDHRVAAMGLWIVALFGVASIVDYPIRVPSLACLFSVALMWIFAIAPDRRTCESN
jgi:O-antigen ligase